MCTEPMEICIGLGLGSVQTLPNIIIEPKSIGVGLCLGLYQCNRTIKQKILRTFYD